MNTVTIQPETKAKLKPGPDKPLPGSPVIKLPNFSVEINCLKCGKDFFKRVHALADVWLAWQNTEHCPNCMKGGKKK